MQKTSILRSVHALQVPGWVVYDNMDVCWVDQVIASFSRRQ